MVKGKKILVVGLGISGRSAVDFLLRRGAKVLGVDDNKNHLLGNNEIRALRDRGLVTLHQLDLVDLFGVDTVVLSPGVPLNHPLCQKARLQKIEIIGEIELACRLVKQPFLGITGTNGKTTVCMLVGHVLNHARLSAQVLGNVGTPLTGYSGGDLIVCELSSYQLESMQSPIIDCAALLNITPDHLDRYASMESYAQAKIKIASCMKKQGKLFVNERVIAEFGHLFSEKPRTFGFDPSSDVWCDKNSIFIKENIELILPNHYRGKSTHDVENIMAAFALCSEMGVDPDVFREAFDTFAKPAHRLEYVRELEGVRFYNDSKGTNPGAVERAVESMEGKVALIAGGVTKGVSFKPWVKTFGDKVKWIGAIGEGKNQLYQELSGRYTVQPFENLEAAVHHAFGIAEDGECVLLSPGCASFDHFKNYEHRGQCFKEIVAALKGKGA